MSATSFLASLLAWPWDSPLAAVVEPTMMDQLAEIDPYYAGKVALGLFVFLKLDFVATSIARWVPGYNPIINAAAPFLVPLFVKISPMIKPIYALTDMLLFKNHRSPSRPSASSKPIVIFASRTVKDEAKYKKEFETYAGDLQRNTLGVRAAFSFMDRDKPNTALQFFWFDGPSDVTAQPSKLTACYKGTTKTDYCQSWGGIDEKSKKLLEGSGACTYGFVAGGTRGFLREPTNANKRGFTTGSVPMIWVSKRPIKPGRLASCGKHFQAGTDMMYPNAPAALGIAAFTEEQSEWALRVFNDYYAAFKAHFPVPSWILFRMVFNVIPEWEPGLFPIGFSFSAKKDIEAAVKSNGGNAAYKQYYFESDELIGPAPDFGKGF